MIKEIDQYIDKEAPSPADSGMERNAIPEFAFLWHITTEKAFTMASKKLGKIASGFAIASIVVLSGASTADAAMQAGSKKAKPTEVITCRDFIALRDEFKPQVVSYALGYAHAKRPDVDLIDVSGVDRLVPVLVKSCRSRPSETLMQRIKAFFHRL
ncbi:HdeA/HdeB family chaperone [Sphingomonas faeni]|uniref:HdeA/HdeB family chaperone n=1 Tax=Sphingomonas faeni TaxID=185950 RepID=UPI002789F191|nr:HdeA/HdeB family chaperone [Sphingomonas faeni]MDQ0839330.1 hypothetical protein [Sphingomonas faeni]